MKNITFIDAHAHAYPSDDLKILQDRLLWLDGSLSDSNPHKWRLRLKGDLESLLRSERDAGVNRFILLPVSANPAKISPLNKWVVELARTHHEIIPFGTLLPSSDISDREVSGLLDLGIKGIKIHSFLQRINMNTKNADRLLSLLAEAGLPVLLDTLFLPGLLRAKPHLSIYLKDYKQFQTDVPTLANIARRHNNLNIIAAHLGCLYGWEYLEPLHDLENVYYDLSYIAPLLPSEHVLKIIRAKGVERILFGTDAPFRNPRDVVSWFKQLDLSDSESRSIAGENILNLLHTVG